MALCIFNKVLTIKAFEIGLILVALFFPSATSAPTPPSPLSRIESRLLNPCDYREVHPRIRHNRSAKEGQLERYFRIFKNDYLNKSSPKIKELYDVPTDLNTLEFPVDLPIKALKNKKKNYESLQMYIKVFDILAKQEDVQPSGNFTLEDRKFIFDSLTNDSIRLLCGMYDEVNPRNQEMKLSKKVKEVHKNLTPPTTFTYLYAQDKLLFSRFQKFFKTLEKVIPYKKKTNRKKNRQGAGKKNKLKIKKTKVPKNKGKKSKATS